MLLIILSTIFAFILTFVSFYFWHVDWYFLILIFIGGFFLNLVLFFLSAGVVALFGKKELTIKPKKIYNRYIVAACKFLLIFIRIKVILEGEELLDGLEGFEYVSNHQSDMDPIIAIGKLKRNDITFIMKDEIMKVPIVGRFLYLAGFYPLNRKNAREGYKTILFSSKAIESGRAMGLFIEGTRSKGPDLGKFHDGALKMAYHAKKDIVVSVVDNSYNIKNRFPFRKTKVLIKIIKVYSYDEYKDISTNDLSNEIRELMLTNLEESRRKYNNYA